jgi:hypothetical protein
VSLQPARLFHAALAISLAVSAALFFVWSWRWPLVGDASLIHYIAFLIERGWAPYRQLGDMNMPGSYLIEMAGMHLFGTGDLAWRLFDFALMIAASASFFVIARRTGTGRPAFAISPQWIASENGWLAGLFASSLFILIHGRDGLAQGGQRDLTMAVCLLGATAFLFIAVRRGTLWPVALFGLLSGVAVTIKPTSFPLSVLLLFLAIQALRPRAERVSGRSIRNVLRPIPVVVVAAAAYCVAPVIAFVFLLREHAVTAFLAGFHGIIPYYASLGHRPLSFVVLHSFSPLHPLVIAWIVLLILGRREHDWERYALLAGVAFGLINCIVQQRALPYYRYPMLAFLLPLMAIDFTRAASPERIALAPIASSLAARSRWAGSSAATFSRGIALFALAFGGFFLAPQSAILIHRYRWWETDFITSLDQNLNALGGAALSGHIQCIDSISGCGTALYRLRLEPATGVLSDFLLFGAVSDRQPLESIPIIRETRAQLLDANLADAPQVIVVTSHLHIDGPDNFEKLARWPQFADLLASRYVLRTEWAPTRPARWWSREEMPASYRIYTLRGNSESQRAPSR